MDNHKEIMDELSADRGVRILRRDVGKLTFDEVMRELYTRGLSLVGDDARLGDRLLRRLIMDNPLMRDYVPWYSNDVEIFHGSQTVTL